MSKHSQRPWLYRGKSDSVHARCDTHPYGRQIFRFVEDEAPSDADLNVILAAPDLLEAIEAFVNYNAEDNGDVSMLSNEELWLKAERAIARAKGEPE